MPVLCNVEGELLPPERALVPVLDGGFPYGDSVYEVMRTHAGRPFEVETIGRMSSLLFPPATLPSASLG